VRHCLSSFVKSLTRPVETVVLADRCTPAFLAMACRQLRPLRPRVIDNSRVRDELEIEGLPEKNRHLANQLLRMLELAAGHDVAYFCEQDYVFRRGALEACADAFKSIPTLAVLSPFDHPDRHLPAQEPLLASPQVFPGTLTDWKAVSSTNGNFMWRMSFVAPRLAWVKKTLSAGGLDYALTNGVHAQGHVVLSPTTSLVQHIRTDGSNASPTFGPCVSLQMMARATRALRAASRSITTSNERRHRR